jgi:hypothetical protein
MLLIKKKRENTYIRLIIKIKSMTLTKYENLKNKKF